jgi:hypothetical protein
MNKLVETIIDIYAQVGDFRITPYDGAIPVSKADAQAEKAVEEYTNAVIEECAKALEADAKQCDCAALEERECGCGAWCEWKSITSARAVEIVRALKEKTNDQ